mmetsp:Transcript_30510/g.88431  ORF Transcript_30510/g.88431 Transcript_30510/m.88431 type:complete len:250 (-) Transcript_30510:266-1015(-)
MSCCMGATAWLRLRCRRRFPRRSLRARQARGPSCRWSAPRRSWPTATQGAPRALRRLCGYRTPWRCTRSKRTTKCSRSNSLGGTCASCKTRLRFGARPCSGSWTSPSHSAGRRCYARPTSQRSSCTFCGVSRSLASVPCRALWRTSVPRTYPAFAASFLGRRSCPKPQLRVGDTSCPCETSSSRPSIGWPCSRRGWAVVGCNPSVASTSSSCPPTRRRRRPPGRSASCYWPARLSARATSTPRMTRAAS